MKILVTGAAGFIGSHTAERLCMMGHEVTGIDNFSPYYDVQLKLKNAGALQRTGVNVIKADLCDENLAGQVGTGFEYIFHFAAQPGISASVGLPGYERNNVEATRRLLEFAKENKRLQLFVNISTSSVYGFHATGTEEKAPAPVSHYGITKLAAEQLVLKEHRSGKINACSLRLYSVYGPRERPDKLFTRLICSALQGTPFNLYEGSEKHRRSFTYVGDIVDGVTAVIGRETACKGEIINMGNDREHTTQEGIDCVEKLTGRSILIHSSGQRNGDQLHTRANITKAARLLGYAPATTLAQGLEKQIAWQREGMNKDERG
jgi:UDP-glucuronate 4-epimerase